MSHFLYAHKDLTGQADVWKVGKALTPWSAVRLRQRNCWNTVGLDYLFFGRASHIEKLESRVKKNFDYCSGTSLVGDCRTELFQVKEKMLFDYIRNQIKQDELHIKEIVLEKPYIATSFGSCPFKVPSEDHARAWCNKIVKNNWGDEPEQILIRRLFGEDLWGLANA